MRANHTSPPQWIDLPQTIPGWDHFIGAWFIPGPPTIVVDVGPRASVEHLLNSLLRMGITQVDYAWLTHIHIDHAGGLGPFLNKFPRAQAVVPASGLNHLVDPERLWEGSLKTLGDKALAYGPIDPVPAERLIPHQDFSLPGLTILETPGHAPFHLSYAYKNCLYCGESAGIFLPFGEKIYLRPPTPPRFFFELTVESVDKMLSIDNLPIYFGHSGANHQSSRFMLGMYREQLYRWKDIISTVLKEGWDGVEERALQEILTKDPLLVCLKKMDPLSQERERYFMSNSIAGFVGYLKSLS
jgi:glyoxylase-like metal-dependent hydrolase (beta-lactamase superfamily II)